MAFRGHQGMRFSELRKYVLSQQCITMLAPYAAVNERTYATWKGG